MIGKIGSIARLTEVPKLSSPITNPIQCVYNVTFGVGTLEAPPNLPRPTPSGTCVATSPPLRSAAFTPRRVVASRPPHQRAWTPPTRPPVWPPQRPSPFMAPQQQARGAALPHPLSPYKICWHPNETARPPTAAQQWSSPSDGARWRQHDSPSACGGSVTQRRMACEDASFSPIFSLAKLSSHGRLVSLVITGTEPNVYGVPNCSVLRASPIVFHIFPPIPWYLPTNKII